MTADETEDVIGNIMQAMIEHSDYEDEISESIGQVIDKLDEDIATDFKERLKAVGIESDESLLAHFRDFINDHDGDGAGLVKLWVQRRVP